jgi:hypothetical protein
MSLHLNTPVSCYYIAIGFDKVVFLTMNKKSYDESVGKIYSRELHSAMRFLSQLPFARKLD